MKWLRNTNGLRSQSGDTVIEVLISITIVGSILVGSFTISNASFKQIRQAQERSEAQKIATSSVEKLDKFVDNNPSILSGPSKAFCIESASYTERAVGSGVAGCVDRRYRTSITRTTGTDIFITTVSWPGLSGNTENVSFSYKVREPVTP